MITYDYAMLAHGHNWRYEKAYSSLALDFTVEKNKHNNSMVYLTTTDNVEHVENLKTFPIDSEYKVFNACGRDSYHFNYNLKFLCIKNALKECKSEYLIYNDSDELIHEEHTEEKMQNYLSKVKEFDWDITSSIVFPGYRGSYESKYELFNISMEERHNLITFEEGFLVFKNTDKLHKFVEKWEELYWILNNADAPQSAEGLEIGISAAHAQMKIPEEQYYWFTSHSGLLKNMYKSIATNMEPYERFN